MRCVVLISVLLIARILTSSYPALGQTDADTDAAAERAVFLSKLESEDRFTELYVLMHPDAQAVVPESAVVGWYEHEFAPLGPGVITVTDVQFEDWTWEVIGRTYTNAAAVAYSQLFADGSMVEDVLRLVQDEHGSWRWFFGRSSDFVDQQIALYADEALPESSDPPGGRGMIGSDVPGAPPLSAGDAGCSLVELQPGYPGYRGFVTGLYGPGEAACLEDLQRLDPWFDQLHEDEENVAAAERLGLAGDPSVWVWENWLAIEEERRLPLTCYLDAHAKMASGASFVRAPVTQDDVRLRVGQISGRALITLTTVRADLPG